MSGIDKATIDMNATNIKTSPTTFNESNLEHQVEDPDHSDLRSANTKQIGTTVKETNPPIQGAPSTGSINPQTKATRATLHCNDIDWNLQRLEKKYTLIKRLQWTIADTVGTKLLQLDLPNDILVTPAMKTPFQVTAFWRAMQIKFRVILKSSPFYSGSLVIGFLPSLLPGENIDNLMSLIIQLGGQIQHASDDQTIEFSVPFRHYLNFIEAPNDCLGQFGIFVLNKLRTGPTNPNNVHITVYAAIENSEFKVPEFVPEALPFKFVPPEWQVISSKAQSGKFKKNPDNYQGFKTKQEVMEGKATYVEGVDKEQSINDLVCKMQATMLCAGKGYVGEPPVKQFQDHPIDLVQVRKRFRHLGYILSDSGPDGVYTVPPNSIMYIRILGGELVLKAAGFMSKMFRLYRGSLLAKIVPIVKNPTVDPWASNNPFTFELYVINQTPADLSGISIAVEEEFGFYKGGSHYFTPEEPAEVMIPFMSPNFTAVYEHDPTPDPFAKQQWSLVIKAFNTSDAEAKVSFDHWLALGDDFSTGLFTGCPNQLFGPLEYKKQRRTVNTAIAYKSSTRETTKSKLKKIIESQEQAGVLDLIDKAIDTTLPILQTVDELGSLLDAHPVTFQRYPVTTRKIGYTIGTDNIQYVERMAVTNHNGLSLADKEAYGSERETDMYKLMKEIKTLYAQIEWDESAMPESILWWTNVGPYPIEGPITQPFDAVCPLDVFAANFDFWNGGIRLLIDIAASQMHKGQLTLTYHPNLTEPPESLQQATQQYFMTFDLSEGKCFQVVDIPFLSKYPYRPVYNKNARVWGEQTPFNGIVVLWIQNPLRGTTSVSNIVDINIYRAASPDFKLDVYNALGNTVA